MKLGLLALLAAAAITGCATAQTAPMGRDIVPLASAEAPRPVTFACTFGDATQCATTCDAGDAPSCNNLGAMYDEGVGLPRDEAQAATLYARACAGGADAGCANGRRLAARKASAVGPAVQVTPSAAPAPAPPPAPVAVEVPPPPPPAPPPCANEDDCRVRCRRGDEAACHELPGIHISGNVKIYGDVKMFGDVYMYGAKSATN